MLQQVKAVALSLEGFLPPVYCPPARERSQVRSCEELFDTIPSDRSLCAENVPSPF